MRLIARIDDPALVPGPAPAIETASMSAPNPVPTEKVTGNDNNDHEWCTPKGVPRTRLRRFGLVLMIAIGIYAAKSSGSTEDFTVSGRRMPIWI